MFYLFLLGTVAMTDSPVSPPAKPPPVPYQPELNELLDAFNTAYRASIAIVIKAYNSGKEHGKNEAAVELRRVVADALKGPVEAAPKPSESSPEARRAQRGTVKPLILASLKNFAHGAKPAEIAAATGLNENSVRGALNSFSNGEVVKHGDRWRLLLPSHPPPPPK